jgi:hypothetical protein
VEKLCADDDPPTVVNCAKHYQNPFVRCLPTVRLSVALSNFLPSAM